MVSIPTGEYGGRRGAIPTERKTATPGQPRLPSLIRALCPDCREVDIAAVEARLEIVDWIEEATCWFTCPRCNSVLSKSVPPPLVQVLIRMGVRYGYAEQMPPSPPPPLTTSDLERFLQDLTTFDG